ncbi:MAG: hypothetical protein AABX23_03880 [Nanoarchaeota archaeon]
MSAKLFTLSVIIFLALAFVMFLFIDSFNGNLNEATGLVVNTESFPNYLETHPAVESLPKSSSLELIIGSKTYEIDGKNVILSDGKNTDKDIKVILPQGYESVIGEIGLCDAIKKANKNKELDFELYVNKATLLLKYRKLLKYSDCLN